MTKMAKIDSLFMTKTAENHILWGCTYLHSPYKGVPPGGGGARATVATIGLPWQAIPLSSEDTKGIGFGGKERVAF